MSKKSVNINEFTLDELEKLEMLTGLSFEEISQNFGRARVIKSVLWIDALRTNPDAKIEDFGAMTITEATEVFAGEDPKA